MLKLVILVLKEHYKTLKMQDSFGQQSKMTFVYLLNGAPFCQFNTSIKPLINPMPFTLATYAPMEMLCIDTIGPLPSDDLGNQYIIAIIDAFTR
jgi:hypothetical protein